MLVKVLLIILKFKWFILLTIACGLLLGFIGHLFCEKTEWNQKRLKFLGLFINLETLKLVWLCSALLRCLFVISIMVFCTEIEVAQIYLFVLLCLVYNLLYFRVFHLLFDLFNSVIIFIALLSGNILFGYLQEIIFDWRTLTVYILLTIFIIIYSLYFFMRDVNSLISEIGGELNVAGKK